MDQNCHWLRVLSLSCDFDSAQSPEYDSAQSPEYDFEIEFGMDLETFLERSRKEVKGNNRYDKTEIMKIVVIGGNGTIGRKVVSELEKEHEVIIAGRNTDPGIDIADAASIKSFFNQIGHVDAIVNIAGEAKWAPFTELSEEDYYIGIRSKLMGQVNLVRIGQSYVSEGGSITLSTGILADRPVPMTASAAMVNGAIHSFVQAAALEITDFRLNVVSLGLVEDSAEKYKDFFPGHNPVSMNEAGRTYAEALFGKSHGLVLRSY